MSTMRHHTHKAGATFNRAADWTVRATGTATAFAVALASVLVWLAFAPLAGGFGNTNYQLIINTSTTIVTFLMIFLVQNAQNRSAHHDEQMRVRMERMEREHGQELAALHALIADLHSHTTCAGHTTIGSVRADPPKPLRAPTKARVKA